MFVSLEEEFEELINDINTSCYWFNINKPKDFRIDVQYVHFLVKYFHICSWEITL